MKIEHRYSVELHKKNRGIFWEEYDFSEKEFRSVTLGLEFDASSTESFPEAFEAFENAEKIMKEQGFMSFEGVAHLLVHAEITVDDSLKKYLSNSTQTAYVLEKNLKI